MLDLYWSVASVDIAKPSREADMNGKIETVNSVHILDIVSRSISTDGTSAMVIFSIADGTEGKTRNFGITIAVNKLPWLRGIIHAATNDAAKSRGQLLLRSPANDEVVVFHSPDMKGTTMLQFDARTPNEDVFVITNMTGMKLAGLLESSISPRLSAEERAQLKLFKPKFILPGAMQ